MEQLLCAASAFAYVSFCRRFSSFEFDFSFHFSENVPDTSEINRTKLFHVQILFLGIALLLWF